ncbi:ftsH extracellular protease family isoform X2 [Wolffia australiana]
MAGGKILPCRGVPFLDTGKPSVRFSGDHPNVLFFSRRSFPIGILRRTRNREGRRFAHRTVVVFQKMGSGDNGDPADDFASRVLRENPSQVEPRFLVGDKFLTLREKEKSRERSKLGVLSIIKSLLSGRRDSSKESPEVVKYGGDEASSAVYLKDLLREFKGELYVPEEVFRPVISEEEEFERNLELLPRMSLEDFGKYLKADQIKLLTSKSTISETPFTGFRDFIIDLKEIPGDKTSHRTKWAISLTANQARMALEQYTGPRYEIEKYTTSYIGKLLEYPNPVASSISSRIMVELGMVTAVLAAAAAVIGGFFASAVIAATSFLYALAFYVVWPIVRPLLKFGLGIILGVLESVWDQVIDLFSDGGFFSKIYEFYTFRGVSSSLTMMKPILLVLGTMVLLIRFTLSRRPKNFRKWDIWQGIEFSQSKPQARVDGSTGVLFSDVAGIDEAVDELQELVDYLKNPKKFDEIGIKPPHGVLLEGPPGCGKTLVAKAIAGEAGVPFYQMAGSEFVEVLVGVGSARIRDLFKRAKVNKPAVVFIDEIDALATRRQGIFSESTNYLYNAATQERETTLNQLLIELDGFDTGKGVIFLGATNRMDLLDPALLRPGRFDRKIRIRPSGAKGRLDILKVHARKVKMSQSVDLSNYAQNLPGWSGAKLAQLLQEAALIAVRNRHTAILQSDMDEAVDRLTVGPKRLGIELGHQGQSRRATTEVGAAMTSHLLRRYENAKVESCERISINPRGETFSQVVFHRLDEESYMFERRPQLLHRLQVLLGGRAAEEVIYGRDTSKASLPYLADASWLARKMLSIWNLESPMTIHGEPPAWKKSAKFIGPRLDFEGSLYDDYDLIEPPVNFNLDDEVAARAEELTRRMYEKTLSLLRRHHAALVKSVKVLLDRKEISGDHIEFILDNYPENTPVEHVLHESDPGRLPSLGRDSEMLPSPPVQEQLA